MAKTDNEKKLNEVVQMFLEQNSFPIEFITIGNNAVSIKYDLRDWGED